MTHRWIPRTLLVLALTLLGSEEARANPVLFITPNVATLDFGTTTVGTPITRTVFLQNVGTSDLFIYAVNLTGEFSAVNPPSPFLPIPAGLGVFMDLRMNASSVGIQTGLASYSTNSFFGYSQNLTGVVEDGPGDPQVFVVQANADAMVRQGSPDTNFGGSYTLGIRRPSTGLGRHSFLRFHVPAFTGDVQSAVLRIRTKSTTINQAQVYDVDMGWSENTITWNNWMNGGTTFTFLRNTGTLPADTWHEIDVKEAIPPGGGTVTIGLTTNLDQTLLQFHSRESQFKPTLEVVTR